VCVCLGRRTSIVFCYIYIYYVYSSGTSFIGVPFSDFVRQRRRCVIHTHTHTHTYAYVPEDGRDEEVEHFCFCLAANNTKRFLYYSLFQYKTSESHPAPLPPTTCIYIYTHRPVEYNVEIIANSIDERDFCANKFFCTYRHAYVYYTRYATRNFSSLSLFRDD